MPSAGTIHVDIVAHFRNEEVIEAMQDLIDYAEDNPYSQLAEAVTVLRENFILRLGNLETYPFEQEAD